MIETPAPTQIRSLITRTGFSVREYQVQIIKEVLSSLAHNESTIVNIPQGLGKTFISQVVAVLAHSHTIGPEYKTLFLVPTRALAAQHLLMARWMTKHGRLLAIEPGTVKESFVLRNGFGHSPYILSTPILLHNRLAGINAADLAKVKVCVIDEIDMFAVTDWPAIRFHKATGLIVKRLIDQACVFVGLTASRLSSDQTGFWQDQLKFRPVTAYTRDMVRFLPFTPIEPIAVTPHDNTLRIDSALAQAVRAAHRCLFEMGIPRSLRGLHVLVAKLARGQPARVRLGRSWVRINGESPALQSLCLAIKAAQNTQIALFEDTIKASHIHGVCGALRRHLALLPENAVSDSTRATLGDAADGLAQLAPAACSLGSQVTPKKSRVMQTLRAHHGAKALVFCRFVELAEALHALAAEARLQSHVIHGQLGQHEMLSRMAAFRWDRSVDLAFMTRDLGGRGLDFPDARHLVLYSPRSDFTSADQEVCRIRSNRDDPKPVYLLYYARTAEESKAQALLAKMSSAHTVGGHNAYEIRETSPH